jgi:hypothetical protein
VERKIKSIEIFPNIFGNKYQSIKEFPVELLELIKGYESENNLTIRIYSNIDFMEKVYDVCFKYDIRCQRYIS